jgi:hypothetical protein
MHGATSKRHREWEEPMEDVLFVQFYDTKVNPIWPSDAPFTVAQFANGFSSVWNECKNMGDFFWVEGVSDFNDYAAMATNPLPIEKGKVYISAWYSPHLVQAFIWATMYPDIEFVVGGHSKANRPTYPDLPNLRITEGLAEREIFGTKEVSKNWHLEIPDDLLPESIDTVMFSYAIERKCYWGKCNFCDDGYIAPRAERLGNDGSSLYLPDTRIPGKLIFLYEPSMSPNFLRRHYKNLPVGDDVCFDMFCRGDHAVAQAMREIFGKGEGPKPTNTYWSVGVEFPSNRMLEWMCKGATVESLLETVKVALEHKARLIMLLMTGWDDLVDSDVEEAIKFFDDVKECVQSCDGSIQFIWTDLLFTPGTRLTEEYLGMEDKRKRMTMDAWGAGVYKIAIDERQRELNERAVNACREAFPGKEMVQDRSVENLIFPPGGSDADAFVA